MTNQRYSKANNHFGMGDIDLINDKISVLLTSASEYNPDLLNDEYLSDIPVNARLYKSDVGLEGKSLNDGVFSADDYMCTGVLLRQIDHLILFKDTGVDATSILIAFFDQTDIFPFTPINESIEIRWSKSVNRIFKI